jgi:hypothetical protein
VDLRDPPWAPPWDGGRIIRIRDQSRTSKSNSSPKQELLVERIYYRHGKWASPTATTKRRRVQRRRKEISPRSLSPRLPRTPVRCCRCRGLPANPKTLKQNSFSPFTHRRVLIDPHHTIHVHTQIGSNEPVSYESRSHLNGFLSWIFPLLGSFLPKSQSVFPGPFCSIHLVPTFIHLFFIPFNLPTSHQPRFHPSGLHYRLFSFSFSFSFYFSSKTFYFSSFSLFLLNYIPF